MSDTIVLGYWAIRGRGQTLRHLLAYTGLKFQEKAYKSPQEYGKDVAGLGNFPNLPYLKDGDFVFTQTLGIARYIVRRAGRPQMLGKTPEDQAIMDNFIYAFDDMFIPLAGMFFNKKVMDVKAGHFYKIKSTLERFDKFLQGQQYVLNYPTIADFFLAENSHYIEKLYPQEFPKFKNIIALRTKIENLPEVKKYYERPNAILTPFLPPQKTAFPFFWPGTQMVIPNAPKPLADNTKKSSTTNIQKVSDSPTKVASKEPTHEPAKQKVAQPVQQQPNLAKTQEAHHQVEVQQDWANKQVQYYVPQNPHKIVVISGSASGASPINFLLQSITNIGHPALYFEWCDLSHLQLHNEDIDDGTESANALRGQVYEASAILIGVSETHNMVSTALTNAYNWLIPVLKEKPVALVSIQSSEEQFRKALDKQGVPYFKNGKLSVKDAATFFNAEGALDGGNLKKVIDYFNRLAHFIETGN